MGDTKSKIKEIKIMAIVSKIITDIASLQTMLDSVFNPANQERFYALDTADSKRGSSTAGNLYNSATAGSGNASVALASNVVITVNANSTGSAGVEKLVYAHYISEVSEYHVYEVTLSPVEEFQYQGTITITTATITLSGTMT
jgi:hypothetical protein